MLKIAIIEDDKYFRKDMAYKLSKFGEVHEGASLEDALKLFKSSQYNVALIDLNLNGKIEGLAIIKEALKKGIRPIVVTGYASEELISKAYALGCKHYYNKVDLQNNINEQLMPYLRGLEEVQDNDLLNNHFISHNTHLIKNITLIKQQAHLKQKRVFLTGESGTGKTTIAKIIHFSCEQSSKNLVHIDLRTLQEDIIGPLLFGYKKGAFAGASKDHTGFLERAENGTLILDEISFIPPPIQKRLLEALESKQFFPFGSDEPTTFRPRLITTTNANVEELIETEKLRLDFYFAIKGVELNITPLRERTEDIKPLIDYFIKNSSKKVLLSNEALEILKKYRWHGNVYEIEQFVQSTLTSDIEIVGPDDLPKRIKLNKTPQNKNLASSIYSKSISNFIKKHGLKKLIEVIEIESFKEFYEKNHLHFINTLDELKVSRTTGYRIKENIKKQNKEKYFDQ